MADSRKRDEAVRMLRQKQAFLRQQGLDRFPQRGDFTAEEIVRIKAYLGPWPRALEAAGLKPARTDSGPAQQRRIAAKRKRTAAKIAAKQSDTREQGGGTGES